MKNLREIELKKAYSSDTSNLLESFYIPVLECAKYYDRVTGFFSPRILAVAARGFAQAIKNGVKIRLVTSIKVDDSVRGLTEQDIAASIDGAMSTWDTEDIQTEIERDYLGVFSHLLRSGMLKMKIAVMDNDGIFHQKVGIVTDDEKNSISFSGSNNETVRGWSRNVEEFKVFNNWSLASMEYFSSDREKFDNIWHDRLIDTRVVELSQAVKTRLVEYTKSKDSVETLVQRIERHEQEITGDTKKRRSLRSYQSKAIDFWFENDCTAIFAMATGTGKTFTTINALKRFYEQHGYLRIVVAAPLKTLTLQWQAELLEAFPDIFIINTTEDGQWKTRLSELRQAQRLARSRDYIVITTYATFPHIDEFGLGDDLVLIADEMHNLLTERGLKAAAGNSYRYRLGLSATPLRIWRPDESSRLLRLFGHNIYEYDIKEALADHSLVPFNYYPHFVELDMEEYAMYLELSTKIAQCKFPEGDDSQTEPSENNTLHMLQIQRARIKKDANAKIPYLVEQLRALRQADKLHRTLIYVDNEKFLSAMQREISKLNIATSRFLGNTPDDERARIIRGLCNGAIDAIVAVKCLDEGVDIPAAEQAFLLSNSTEPREYTQRLGRVLRRDDEHGKTSADVHDYIILPPAGIQYADQFERRTMRNMVKGELRRTQFFTDISQNRDEIRDIIEDRMYDLGFDFSEDFNNVEKGEMDG